MIFSDSISWVLKDIITFADDEDIKVLLKNCALGCNFDYSNKISLLDYLFRYIYCVLGPDVEIDFPPKNGHSEDFEVSDPGWQKPEYYISRFKLLYLHLYAISYCYLSYLYCQSTDKKKLKNIAKNKKQYDNEKFNIEILTEKDISKIIKFIINSYNENKFYYCFYNDSLVRIEIEKKQKRFKDYSYKCTYFDLIDTDTKTFIVNKDLNINYCLGQKLIRKGEFYDEDSKQDSKQDSNDNDFICFIESYLTTYSFQNLKKIHSRIIKAIKINETGFCKCCNPNINNPKSTKICDNCKKLFKTFKELQKNIEESKCHWDFSSISDMDLKSVLYTIKTDKKSNSQIRTQRKIKLEKILKKLDDELKKSKVKHKTQISYVDIEKNINKLKTLATICFNNDNK